MFSMWAKVSGAMFMEVKVKVKVKGKGKGKVSGKRSEGNECRKGDGREEPAWAQEGKSGRRFVGTNSVRADRIQPLRCLAERNSGGFACSFSLFAGRQLV